MESEFDSNFFAGNRKRLNELAKGDQPIVVTANGQLQRSGDTLYPFQQDANFWYLTGIEHPDFLLVMENGSEYIILPKRSDYQNTFDGKIDTDALEKRSGIKKFYDYEEGWDRFGSLFRQSKQVATIAAPPEYIAAYGMYTNPARRVLVEKLMTEHHMEIEDIGSMLASLRVVKQPAEIHAIKEAISITAEGLGQVMQPENLRKYVYEYEAEADLTRSFRLQGSQHAFDPIIAGGPRACTLHNTGMNGRILPEELLLFDVGASHKGYAADITRTIALTEPSKRQQLVFDAVKDVQKFAYSILKPGVLMKDYEKQVERYMGEKLIALGLIQHNNTESVRKYYPHATSHHLGLNVHDVGGRDEPLAPNMVITVEPGIYIPEENIGIRIEDDVVITESGVEVLSKALPVQLY